MRYALSRPVHRRIRASRLMLVIHQALVSLSLGARAPRLWPIWMLLMSPRQCYPCLPWRRGAAIVTCRAHASK